MEPRRIVPAIRRELVAPDGREDFHAGDGSGTAAAVFDDSAYDVTIENKGGQRQLWLTVAAHRCGQPPAASFSEESFCDRAIVWDVAARRFDYAPVSTMRMIK
ncbi:MAG: hypothetical protein ABJA98_09780 [Acidobacteriota bacterium]